MSLLRKSGEQRPDSLVPPKLSAGQKGRKDQANATSSITLHSSTTVSSLSGVSTFSDVGGNSSAMVSEQEILSMLRDKSVLPISENDDTSGSQASMSGFSLSPSHSSDASFSVTRVLGKSDRRADEFAVKMINTSGDPRAVLSLDKGVRVAAPTTVTVNRVTIQSGREKTVSPTSPQSQSDVMELSRLLVQEEARTQGSPVSKDSEVQARQSPSPPLATDLVDSTKQNDKSKKVAKAVSKDWGDRYALGAGAASPTGSAAKLSEGNLGVPLELQNEGGPTKSSAAHRAQKQQETSDKAASNRIEKDRYKITDSPLRNALSVGKRNGSPNEASAKTKETAKQEHQPNRHQGKIEKSFSPDVTSAKMRSDRYKSTESPLRDSARATNRAFASPKKAELNSPSRTSLSPGSISRKTKNDRYAIGSDARSPLRGTTSSVASTPTSPLSPEAGYVSAHTDESKEQTAKQGTTSRLFVFDPSSPTEYWDDRYAIEAEPNSPLLDAVAKKVDNKSEEWDRVMASAVNRLGNGTGHQAYPRSKPPMSPKAMKEEVKAYLFAEMTRSSEQKSPAPKRSSILGGYLSPRNSASADEKSKGVSPETSLNLSSAPSDGSVDSGSIALMALSTEEIESIIKAENEKSLHYIPGITLKPRWSSDASDRERQDSDKLSQPKDKYGDPEEQFDPLGSDDQSDTRSGPEELDETKASLQNTRDKEGESANPLYVAVTMAARFLSSKKDDNAIPDLGNTSIESSYAAGDELNSVMAVAGRAPEDKSNPAATEENSGVFQRSADFFRSGISAAVIQSEPDKWCKAPPPEAFDFDCLPRDKYEAMCGIQDTQPYEDFTAKSITSDKMNPAGGAVISSGTAQSTSVIFIPVGKDNSCCGLLSPFEGDDVNKRSPKERTIEEPAKGKQQSLVAGTVPTNQDQVHVPRGDNSSVKEEEINMNEAQADETSANKALPNPNTAILPETMATSTSRSEKAASATGQDSAVENGSNVKHDETNTSGMNILNGETGQDSAVESGGNSAHGETDASGLNLLEKDDSFWDGLSTIASTLEKQSPCRDVEPSKEEELNATNDSKHLPGDKTEHSDGRKCLCCNWKQRESSKSKAPSEQTHESEGEKEKDQESGGGDGRSSPSEDIPHVISLTLPDNFTLSNPVQDEQNQKPDLEAVADTMNKLQELLSDDSSEDSSLSYSRDSEGNGENKEMRRNETPSEQRKFSKQNITEPTFLKQDSKSKSSLTRRPAMYGEDIGEAPLSSPSKEDHGMVNNSSTDETSDGDNTESRDESGSYGQLERYLERTMPVEETTSSEDVVVGGTRTSSQDATGSTRISSTETTESLKDTPSGSLVNAFSSDSDDVGALLLSVTRSDSDFVPPYKNGSFDDANNIGDLEDYLDSPPDRTNTSKPFDRRQPSLGSISEQVVGEMPEEAGDSSIEPQDTQDSNEVETFPIDGSTKADDFASESTSNEHTHNARKEVLELSEKNIQDSKATERCSTTGSTTVRRVTFASNTDKEEQIEDKSSEESSEVIEEGVKTNNSDTDKSGNSIIQKQLSSTATQRKKEERIATTDSETESTQTPAMDEVLSKYDAIVIKLLKKNTELKKQAAKGEERSPSADSIEMEKMLSDIRAQSGQSSALKGASMGKERSASYDSAEIEKTLSAVRAQAGNSILKDATATHVTGRDSESKDDKKSRDTSLSVDLDKIELPSEESLATDVHDERPELPAPNGESNDSTTSKSMSLCNDSATINNGLGDIEVPNMESVVAKGTDPPVTGHESEDKDDTESKCTPLINDSVTVQQGLDKNDTPSTSSVVTDVHHTRALPGRNSDFENDTMSKNTSPNNDSVTIKESSEKIEAPSVKAVASEADIHEPPAPRPRGPPRPEDVSSMRGRRPTRNLQSAPLRTRQRSPEYDRNSSVLNVSESIASDIDQAPRKRENESPSRQGSPSMRSVHSSASHSRHVSPRARSQGGPEVLHEGTSPARSRQASSTRYGSPRSEVRDSPYRYRHGSESERNDSPYRNRYSSPTRDHRESPLRKRYGSPELRESPVRSRYGSPLRDSKYSPSRSHLHSPTREYRESPTRNRYGSQAKGYHISTRENRESPTRNRYDSPTNGRHHSPSKRFSPSLERHGLSPTRRSPRAALVMYRRERAQESEDYFSDDSDAEMVYLESRKTSPLHRRRERAEESEGYFSDDSDPETVYLESRRTSPVRRRCYSLSPVRKRHDKQFSAHMKKARNLRTQLDTARLSSQSIRRCHACLSLELNTFKHKLHRHAKSKQDERALLVASQNVLKEYQERLHQKGGASQQRETISNNSHDDFEDVRHLMLRNLKLLNEAQYALVEEKMRIKEKEKKRHARQTDVTEDDRLKDIKKTLDELRGSESINNEVVLKCLDNARELLRSSTSNPTLHGTASTQNSASSTA